MKRIYILFLMGIISFLSCEDEKEFPAPKFKFSNGIIETTFRRDTLDKYTIRAEIFAPNGIRKLTVIDGITYQEIETIPAQGSQYQLNYELDYRQVDVDTTLVYLFKVEDHTGRTMNNAFSVNMIRSSHPNVQFYRDKMVTSYDAYPVSGTVTTGFNAIKTVRITQNGVLISEINGETLADSSLCAFNVMSKTLSQGTNEISVFVEDIKQQTIIKVMQVERIPKPEMRLKQIKMTNPVGALTTYDYTYNQDGKVSKIVSTLVASGYTESSDFTYNSSGKIEKIVHLGSYLYTYTYISENGKLTKMMYSLANRTTGVVSSTTTPVEQIQLYDDGRIKQYYARTKTIVANYATIFGEEMFIDCLNGTGYSVPASRDVYEFVDRVPNPFYIEELPQLPEIIAYLTEFYFTPYMFYQRVRDLDRTNVQTRYSYELDELGRVVTLRKVMPSSSSQNRNYEFIYMN